MSKKQPTLAAAFSGTLFETLSLVMFLNFFLIFAGFQPHVSDKNVSYKNVSYKKVSYKKVSYKNVSYKNVSFEIFSYKNCFL